MEQFIEHFSKTAKYFNYTIIRLNNDSLAFFIDNERTEYGYPYFSVKIYDGIIYINEIVYKFPPLKDLRKQISIFFGDYIGYLETTKPQLYLVFCHNKIMTNNFELNNKVQLNLGNAAIYFRGHDKFEFITQIDMNYYNTIFVTVDIQDKYSNISADAFSEKFISQNEGVYDAIALPDCNGPWSEYQYHNKNYDELVKIVQNVSRLVKKNGSILVGKFLDEPSTILGQEYKKYTKNLPFYGKYINFHKH